MKIQEIKAAYQALDPDYEPMLQQFIHTYGTDARSGVQTLVEQTKKKLVQLEAEYVRSEKMLAFERKYHAMGSRYICGIDEVGRGPLAGPVVACAVILPEDEMLLHLRTQVRKNAEEEKLGIAVLEEFVQEQENSLQIKVKMELISVREQKYQETAIRRLREYILTAKKEHVRSAENGFKRISKCFEKEAVCREDMIQKLQGELQNAFLFIKESFGENQEMLLFVTGITADKSMTSFIAGNGCPAYFEHSEMLLYNKEENELRKACLEAVHDGLQEE